MCSYDAQSTAPYIRGGSEETLGICVSGIDLWRTERADWSVTYIGHKGYVFYHYMGDLGNPMYLSCIGLVRDVFLRHFLCLCTNQHWIKFIFLLSSYASICIYSLFLVTKKLGRGGRLVWLSYLDVTIVIPYLLSGETLYSHSVRNSLYIFWTVWDRDGI